MMPSRWIAVLLVTVASLHAEGEPAKPLSSSARVIDGATIDLNTYAGKVVLVVNVASRCGFTRHYRELQATHEKYEKRGLVVLGFPCNQFGKQEPGTDAEIKAFCQKKFGVTFPMFSKIEVSGEQAHPLYVYLTSKDVPIDDRGPVKWNFEKFLIDRNGKLIARYRSRVKPDASEVVEAIEKALAAKPD